MVAEGSSDGASQTHLSILQVFPLQVFQRDWLPVKLIPQLLILGNGPCDHQHVLKQEHMQLLQNESMGRDLFVTEYSSSIKFDACLITNLRVASPKNEKNYHHSPPCHFKPIRLSLIFET